MKYSASKLSLLTLLALVVLTGCDSSSDGEDDMVLGMERRLLVAEAGEPLLRILDVENGEQVANLALAGPIRAYLKVEESGRYAFLAPTGGPIQTVDGGVFVDDGRLVEQMPSIHSFNVPGDNLVHLTYADGLLAGFYDGTGEARFFKTDDVVRTGPASVTTLASGSPHHGVAVAIGADRALITKPADGETLPVGVTGHAMADGSQVFSTSDCPGLHGSAHGSGGGVGFGCTDGVLVVKRSGSDLTAVKVDNPAGLPTGARTGTLHGHSSVSYLVAPFSAGGVNLGPAIYDPATDALTMMELPGRAPWSRGYGFTPGGKELLALGLDGTLHILDGRTRAVRGSVSGVAQPMAADPLPRGTAYPTMTAGAHFVYVADPNANTITEVSLSERRVTRTWQLDFTPGVMGLVGTDDR
jgi:hypothetical protein